MRITAFTAILGAVPLAVGAGVGAELRQPLGISIIGGLVASQLLTLFTTPVVDLALDPLRSGAAKRSRFAWATSGTPVPATRTEEHTSGLQSHLNLLFHLLLVKKKTAIK